MLSDITKQLRTAITLLIVLTLLTGLVYPLLVTTFAQLVFPNKANGSLIKDGDTVIGSRLIGQYSIAPNYFWGRPSATAGYPYNALASGGSNLGPANPQRFKQIEQRIAQLQLTQPDKNIVIPIDLVTSSGSGLDPHISVPSALYQVNRIAKARNIDAEVLQNLIQKQTELPALNFLGKTRVNVLELNRALDKL